ncbi:MFS transporter [Promicromonospora thailandica]|uniref:Arabinose efflux permease, MFS family n=1 Tax=Promicromonospora thailandica TaxID=765201 RepID=A0A9X2JY66_9MICO|nr:MFS transporter [Promicromonospora thailandica]MCP2266898.1 putative arabinose efflux permease, MFS family [Promicromonospora thailandica]BFF16566.1 MFS transporter [Promicromonospora thailandica]
MTREPVAAEPRPSLPDGRATCAPYAAFAAFGIFWGAWGAALPALRTQAGVSEGELGTALLFVGFGALPSMAFTGRAVDRYGLRVAAWLLAALAGAGLLITAGARGVVPLIVGMLVVGAASGAADVAINTLAGRAEHATAKPLLTRSHGLFSVGVVVASLSTGALLGTGLSLLLAFAVVAAVMLALATTAWRTSTALRLPAVPDGAAAPRPRGLPDLLRRIGPTSPLFVVGLVAALAYAIENAHQSWGAVLLTDVFTAPPPLAAAAPATFAATAALARLSLAPLSRSHPTTMLLGGGALAAAGTAVLATAPSVTVALVGLVLAALGTATLFPTLLSRSLRRTDPAQHGRATSEVATTAYLGFLLGPAYVGLLAESSDLRGALLGVAALALVFTVAAAPTSAWAARRHRPATADSGPPR